MHMTWLGAEPRRWFADKRVNDQDTLSASPRVDNIDWDFCVELNGDHFVSDKHLLVLTRFMLSSLLLPLKFEPPARYRSHRHHLT
jgi:hypothetical protein